MSGNSVWKRFRRLFNRREVNAAPEADDTAHAVNSLSLDQLYVAPNESEDFDAGRCVQLLQTIADRGGTTVEKATGVIVTLEDFFEGNQQKASIAANVEPDPPFDSAQAWYDHLKQIRGRDDVHDVLVEISDVEPYEDGRISFWPYSDTIWIYSSLNQSAVAKLVAPLDPDEVRNAATPDENWDLTPPFPAPEGFAPFWIWWD